MMSGYSPPWASAAGSPLASLLTTQEQTRGRGRCGAGALEQAHPRRDTQHFGKVCLNLVGWYRQVSRWPYRTGLVCTTVGSEKMNDWNVITKILFLY